MGFSATEDAQAGKDVIYDVFQDGVAMKDAIDRSLHLLDLTL